ncbi:6-phospho-beta-glucosidase [Jatrophihabitans fulvus]
MKLCILGGGGFRTPFVHQALLRDEHPRRVDTVTLYDTDADRLAVMTSVLAAMAEPFAHPPRVLATTDLAEAVRGSDFVFAAVRVGGVHGRVCDERVALDLGVLGQETTGPGGLAYALRTVPVMDRIATTIRELAPDAFVLNFTNPAGILTETMRDVLGDRVVGICDTPSGLGRRIAGSLGLDPGEVTLDYVGLNHLGWLRRVLHRGRDVLPDLFADEPALAELEEGEVFGTDWLRTFGVVPNEYLYYWYRHREALAAILAAPATRGEELERSQTAFYSAAAAGGDVASLWRSTVQQRHDSYMADARATPRPAGTGTPETDPEQQGYAGVALAVMAAIGRDERASAILNVRNGTTVAALPSDAVVEVPCIVDGNGAHPLATPPPDAHQLGLMSAVKAVERHVITAARTGSRGEALQAFALHPLVGSLSVARDLLDGYIARIPEVRAVFER